MHVFGNYATADTAAVTLNHSKVEADTAAVTIT